MFVNHLTESPTIGFMEAIWKETSEYGKVGVN